MSIGKTFKIGELAELAQVSKRTVDYYTRIGLLKAQRSESNYRFYTEESLEHLRLIESLKKQNLHLDQIKERLDLLRESPASVESVVEKVDDLHDQMKRLEQKMLELKPLLEKLNEKQLKTVTNSLSSQGISLVHSLALLLGENPLI